MKTLDNNFDNILMADEFILVLGFGDDTFSVAESIHSGLSEVRPNLRLETFTGKWELKYWLEKHSKVILHSRQFRHDSRIFYNSDRFCTKQDYEDTFFWNKYHSSNIKLLVISSCTRELDSGLSDIVYDNLDFCKNILPKVPKILMDFSDGEWCTTQTSSYLKLFQDFKDSVYHIRRDISTPETRQDSNLSLAELSKRLIKSNYNMLLETYLEIYQK